MNVEHVPNIQARAWYTVYDGDVRYVRREAVWEPEGRVLYKSPWKHNLVVTAGKDLVLDRLFALSGPPTAINSIGVGTDATAAGVGQVQLNPLVPGTVFIQAADGGTSRTAETVSIQSTFGTLVANFVWNECALFNGTTNGVSTMFDRLVIGPFTKTSAVSVVLAFAITQS